MNIVPECKVCHKPLNVHNSNGLEQAECLNPTCDLETVTAGLEELASLTVAEITAWGEMNRKKRARTAAYLANEANRMYSSVGG